MLTSTDIRFSMESITYDLIHFTWLNLNQETLLKGSWFVMFNTFYSGYLWSTVHGHLFVLQYNDEEDTLFNWNCIRSTVVQWWWFLLETGNGVVKKAIGPSALKPFAIIFLMENLKRRGGKKPRRKRPFEIYLYTEMCNLFSPNF